MPDLPEKARYDVAVIGAGIGGLTAANLLAKAGLSVCLLEKEPHVGGYLAGFRRGDFRFDTALHWLNQCGKGGLVDRVFEFLGHDQPLAMPQTRIRRYKGKRHDFLLTNNPDDFKDQLIEAFPHEKIGIEKFFRLARKIGHSLNQFNRICRSEETMSTSEKFWHKLRLLRFAMPFIPLVGFSGQKGLARGLRCFFKDERIHKIFAAERELISCLVPIGWAYYGDFQHPPAGGGQVLPEWLAAKAAYYGVDILRSCRVEKILTNGNLCQGIVFERKGKLVELRSKYVVAASDVETLYEKMLPADRVSAELKMKLKTAELYHSSITLSIALDCTAESLGFGEEMIHLTDEDQPYGEHENGDPRTSEISILAPSARDKTLAPAGAGTLTIYMPAEIGYRNNWFTEKDREGNYLRGPAYRELKHEMAGKILQRVEEKIAPGLRSHILFYEVSTPITYWRYTGNRNGTIMGARPGRKNMARKIAHYQTPVRNLILGGHWAELGGGVPIAVKAGMNAALLILRKEKKSAFFALKAYLDKKTGLPDCDSGNLFKSYHGQWKQGLTPAQKKAGLALAASPEKPAAPAE